MEQRRLRLGDILDDYCPRERRLTNHAVVAMIEEDVKQTRCTTCDAEHAYKGGKVPKRRKKETTATLYKEVLAGQTSREDAHIVIPHDSDETEEQPTPAVAAPVEVTAPVDPPSEPVVESAVEEVVAPADSGETDEMPTELEEGPVHRPLIRAQLPRIEGQKEERRLPDFTIRQRGNGHFRGDARMKPHRHGGNGHAGNGGANGNRTQGGSRFAGQRPSGAGGRGQSGRGGGQSGFRSGQRQGGGRKRSR
jgi:hypothetical protein